MTAVLVIFVAGNLVPLVDVAVLVAALAVAFVAVFFYATESPRFKACVNMVAIRSEYGFPFPALRDYLRGSCDPTRGTWAIPAATTTRPNYFLNMSMVRPTKYAGADIAPGAPPPPVATTHYQVMLLH